MRVAYLILAHNTPNHLSRLVRALDSPNADFFIHVDRKSDISPFRDRFSQSNVRFAEDRVAVYWGEFSIVQASVSLIREALNHLPAPHYLVLLSASDYPLRSSQYIEAFFLENQRRQFINMVQMPCEPVGKLLERLEQYWLQTPNDAQFVGRVVARLNHLINNQLKLIKRDYEKVFSGLVPYAGSQWWALTKDACRHVLEFIDSRSDVVKFFRNVAFPDESFFHTIIGNSKFATQVRRNLTFHDWSRSSGPKPAIIDMDHLNAFMKTPCLITEDPYGRGELLFARKFPDDSSHLTDFIDANLINCTDPQLLTEKPWSGSSLRQP
jgi:Core-2/I-Branching enzyme